MEHVHFHIGDRFWTHTGEWRCTDVGNTDHRDGEISGSGLDDVEIVVDENDVERCYPTAAERDADA